MKTLDRRDFLKKATLAGASAIAIPSVLESCGTKGTGEVIVTANNLESKLIVPHSNGMRITGTFLDEISHDIPHQNWGEKEWDLDFQHMKNIGIDTVIMIRSGYRKFITFPSEYLLKKGCYMPSVDLLDMYLRLAEKYGMKFYFGLYDSGRYWDTGDMTWEVEDNKYVIDEVWKKYGSRYKSFGDGTSVGKSVGPLKEPLVLSMHWVNNVKMYQMDYQLLYLLGLMERKQSWEPIK